MAAALQKILRPSARVTHFFGSAGRRVFLGQSENWLSRCCDETRPRPDSVYVVSLTAAGVSIITTTSMLR